jgi:parvulin-like peptidyl-prolyl isomerase
MENTPTVETLEKKPDSLGRLINWVRSKCKKSNLKFKKPKFLTSVAVVIVLVLAILFYAKGLFIAATVNGSPISRLSVIQELETQGGKQALDAMISKSLIQAEFKKQHINVTSSDVDDEIKKIEAQVTSQGGTLDEALAAQGMTEAKLREQITLQKGMEKVLADKIAVSDADIDAYLKDNHINPPKDMKIEDVRQQVSDQLQQQKIQQEAQKWVDGLKASAKINYYVNY